MCVCGPRRSSGGPRPGAQVHAGHGGGARPAFMATALKTQTPRPSMAVVRPESLPDTQRPGRGLRGWCCTSAGVTSLLCLSFPMCAMEPRVPPSQVGADSFRRLCVRWGEWAGSRPCGLAQHLWRTRGSVGACGLELSPSQTLRLLAPVF